MSLSGNIFIVIEERDLEIKTAFFHLTVFHQTKMLVRVKQHKGSLGGKEMKQNDRK